MKFKIIKKSPVWFSLSAALVGISIVLVAMGGLRMGIDFTGGTLLEVSFAEKISTEEFTKIFNETLKDKGEKVVETEKGFIIRSRTISPADQTVLAQKFQEAGKPFEVDRTTSIGPTVGSIFKQRAMIAIGVAIVAIIFFIAFAFRRVPQHISPWKFGLSAIIALVHDVVITIGVFALLGFFYGVEVDGLFITALLTVMGFSVHDTIVVFDRLRENLKAEASMAKFPAVAESALWQTMARSINTSLSTLIVLGALMIFGSETLFFFLLALVVGITVGTYSSIFLATPILVAWQKK